MKLFVERKQKSTKIAKYPFEVSFRLEVSEDEAELIKKYNLQNRKLGVLRDLYVGGTVDECVKGIWYSNDNVLNLLAVEEVMKKDCQELKNYLEIANGYGGREVFEC